MKFVSPCVSIASSVFLNPVSHQSAALIEANTLMTHKRCDEDASSSSVCFYSSVLKVEVSLSLSLCLSVPRSPATAALSLIGWQWSVFVVMETTVMSLYWTSWPWVVVGVATQEEELVRRGYREKRCNESDFRRSAYRKIKAVIIPIKLHAIKSHLSYHN